VLSSIKWRSSHQISLNRWRNMEKGRNLFMSLDKVWLLLDVFSRKSRFFRYFCKELLYRISVRYRISSLTAGASLKLAPLTESRNHKYCFNFLLLVSTNYNLLSTENLILSFNIGYPFCCPRPALATPLYLISWKSDERFSSLYSVTERQTSRRTERFST